MIHGFEEITARLSDDEIALIPEVVNMLNERTKENPIKNSVISGGLIMKYNKFISAPRIRKMINYISLRHMTKHTLVANSKGYYITQDINEIVRYVNSLCDRSEAINVRASSILNREKKNG